ncbi:MAG TPA: hypothetical protein ACFYEK_09080 [Candidatus Wunengus sp. YC60]|uniref:hypothetical protein n=1 Tax=Candidatus Wunengus sp. YC60 TaxID=3367697 RepID=UPI0040277F51
MITPFIKNITLNSTTYTEIVLGASSQNLRSVLIQCRNIDIDIYLANSENPTEYITLWGGTALIIELEALSQTGLWAKAISGNPVVEVMYITKTM